MLEGTRRPWTGKFTIQTSFKTTQNHLKPNPIAHTTLLQVNGWWSQCVDNVRNARAAGFRKVCDHMWSTSQVTRHTSHVTRHMFTQVGVYMWPERSIDALTQAEQLLQHLKDNNVE